MRLASFHTATQGASYGAVTDKGIVDLRRYLGNQFPDLKALIAGNGFSQVGQYLSSPADYQYTDITWLPVIPNPDKIVCVGLNYEEHRAVVVAAVAGDVIPGSLLADSSACLSDDERDLGLEVEVGGLARAQERLSVPDLRLGDAQEQRRVLGLVAPGLGSVLLVVQAHAHDLVRVGDDRQPGDVGLAVIGTGRQVTGCRGKSISCNQCLQVRELVAEIAAQVDNALVGDRAVAGALSSSVETRESHNVVRMEDFYTRVLGAGEIARRVRRE